jgi:hypothetical protein
MSPMLKIVQIRHSSSQGFFAFAMLLMGSLLMTNAVLVVCGESHASGLIG